MQALIENLVKLQAIELNRARLNQQMRALPAEIAQAAAALAAAQRQSADLSAALDREDSMRTRLERDIDTHRQKAAHFRVQVDSVTTPEQAAAIEHEIQFATSEADRLEDEEYASLERTEAHEAALAAVARQGGTAGRRAGRGSLERRCPPAGDGAELAGLDAGRESRARSSRSDWLARFDRIAAASRHRHCPR